VRGAASTRALIDLAAGVSVPDARLSVRPGAENEVIIDITPGAPPPSPIPAPTDRRG
jgi:hypothetical protein